MKLRLTLGLGGNPRTWPVIDGRAAPDGIELVTSVVGPAELFGRQLRNAEFDVAEMSISSLLMITAQGDERFVGLPVFPVRRIFHTRVLVRRDAGIERPADLKGKRVGVPEYQQTAALWIRGVLESEFGVSPKDMEFWMERLPATSHAGAVGFKPPPGVAIRQIPPEKSIGSMMVAGELDAVMFYIRDPNNVDRSREDLDRHPAVKPLFADPAAEAARYYAKTGIYPIGHGMVVRRSLVERHPWIVLNLMKAFDAANAIAERERMAHVAYHLETGRVPSAYRAALSAGVLAHGLKANRKTLETAAAYSHEQGLTPRLVPLETVFAAASLGS